MNPRRRRKQRLRRSLRTRVLSRGFTVAEWADGTWRHSLLRQDELDWLDAGDAYAQYCSVFGGP